MATALKDSYSQVDRKTLYYASTGQVLEDLQRRSPYVADMRLVAEGDVRREPVIIHGVRGSRRQLVATVAHPDARNGQLPTEKQVELFRGRHYANSQQKARDVVAAVRAGGFELAAQLYGAFNDGDEVEYWKLDQRSLEPSALLDADQNELHSFLGETDAGFSANVLEQAVNLASDFSRTLSRYPDDLVLTVGMFPTGRPDAMPLNSGRFAGYVQQMSRMLRRSFEPLPGDTECWSAWNGVARNFGYEDFNDLKGRVNGISPIAFAAGHKNISTVQEREGSLYTADLELMRDFGEVLLSEYALVVNWMMYSSPILNGVRVAVEDQSGQKHHVRSARDVMRRVLSGATEGTLIDGGGDLELGVAKSMREQAADRISRASVVHDYRDEMGADRQRSSQYDQLRMHFEGSPFDHGLRPDNRHEHVGLESTGIVPRSRAGAMEKVLLLLAFEARAKGKSAVEFFDELTGGRTGMTRTELSNRYNRVGEVRDDGVLQVIDNARILIDYVKNNYTHEEVQVVCAMAQAGVDTLTNRDEVEVVDLHRTPKRSLADSVTATYEKSNGDVERVVRDLAAHFRIEAAEILQRAGHQRKVYEYIVGA